MSRSLIIAVVLLVGIGTESAADPPPPATLAALINASAPADDAYSAQFCGGTLVGADLVLTAAHCVTGRRAGSIDVIVGADNLCRSAVVTGERRHVVDTILHPDAGVDRLADAALLRLDRDVELEPAPLVAPSNLLRAFGWGRRSAGGVPSCTPTTVHLEPTAAADCRAVAGDRIVAADRHLCARPAAGALRNTCTGDSGGPVMDDRGGLVGIVTWGPDCDLESVGVYHRADDLERWTDAVASGQERPGGDDR